MLQIGAWVACAALAATLFGHQALAQSVTEPQVELPPEAPKSSPILEVPLPTEPPKPPPAVQKPPPPVEKPKPPPPPAALQPKQTGPAAVPTMHPAPKVTADCVIKPVMTDDELRACGARP